ncbi:MAG TPA: VOC family protein [Syntrophobacteraceae bacterium]|nr:VOC family protein [Syntrophobacteraceae bacterium]
MDIRTANTLLYCTRWKETVEFYRTVLKLPVCFSNEWFVEFMLNDSSRLSVADDSRASVKSGGGRGITVSLHVDDLEAVHGHLREAGCNPSPIKPVWGSPAFTVLDPEGHRLEFWEKQNRRSS